MRFRKEVEVRPCIDAIQEMQGSLLKEDVVSSDLSIKEVSQIIKRISHDLIQQEAHHIPRFKYKIPNPEVSIEDGKIYVSCKIEVTSPFPVDFTFNYSYENSQNVAGGIELQGLKILFNIKSRFKRPARKIINRMNIAEKANKILSNISTELIDLFPVEKSGETTRPATINLRIIDNGINVTAFKNDQ